MEFRVFTDFVEFRVFIDFVESCGITFTHIFWLLDEKYLGANMFLQKIREILNSNFHF
jgi:hypothetical protein